MNIVDALRGKSLVEYIPDLKAYSDGTYRCPCPIHEGHNESSFAVFPDSNRFYCFACGASGDIIRFVMERDKVSFDMAIQTLADDFNLTIEADDKYTSIKQLSDRNLSWARQMRRQTEKVKGYLYERGLTDETINNYFIGYTEKKSAIAIPMFDQYKRIAGFLYRFFEQKPKYKNSKNVDGLFVKGEFLFGIPQAIKHLKETNTLMLCEGAFDCMSAVQQGLCCVAYCGISVTAKHIEAIKRLIAPIKNAKVVLCPDADGKASKFVLRARELFRKHAPKVVVKVAVIPEGYKDFNDMLVGGKDIAKDCTYENLDLYCAKQVIAEVDDTEVQERNAIEFCRTVANPVVKADIAEYLANLWKRSTSIVKELLSVQDDTTEEKLSHIQTIDKAYTALERKQVEETFGIGFQHIDETVQFARKSVVILGAYSFSGKSDNLIEWLLYWCIILKKKCLFFSLEMPVEDVMKIIIAKVCQIPRYTVQTYIKEHTDTYQMIIDKLKEYLYIVDENTLSLDEIADYTRLIKGRGVDIDIVAVDYFQYLKRTQSVEEQENTAKQMKAIAKSLDVTLVMLSQLRKSSQSKEANGKFHEPTQADLAGAGGIGNSGDYIFLIWRPALNSELSPIDREKTKYDTMLKITKAREVRNGNTIFTLRYDPNTSRITEKVEQEES